jgi:hypothetical protein
MQWDPEFQPQDPPEERENLGEDHPPKQSAPNKDTVRMNASIYDITYNLQIQASLSRLQEWLPHRETYVDELLRHDGRAGQRACAGCNSDSPDLFKCKDCFGGKLLCYVCVVKFHDSHPLHRILVRT